MAIDGAAREEVGRVYEAVDAFAVKRKARLREQALKEYRRWDEPA